MLSCGLSSSELLLLLVRLFFKSSSAFCRRILTLRYASTKTNQINIPPANIPLSFPSYYLLVVVVVIIVHYRSLLFSHSKRNSIDRSHSQVAWSSCQLRTSPAIAFLILPILFVHHLKDLHFLVGRRLWITSPSLLAFLNTIYLAIKKFSLNWKQIHK